MSPGTSPLLSYHHDYQCLSELTLKQVSEQSEAERRLERLDKQISEQSEAERRLERFEAVKQAAARFYK